MLESDEPAAFTVERERGSSPFLLICDHASARVPRRLGFLGLSAQELERHIAWDIGAAEVATRLASRLDAVLIKQSYSRLVIDCNRPLGSEQSIVRVSDGTRIPGNESISSDEVQARQREVFLPYHDRIRAELDQRLAQQRGTVVIAMHSFTPTFNQQRRSWHAGLLYHRDRRLAEPLLRALRTDSNLIVGDNEPYAASDETDYAIPVYGEQRGLLHVGIELRQDLISARAGQEEWADRLARSLLAAVAEIGS